MTSNPQSTNARREPEPLDEPPWVTELQERGWTVAVAESMTAGLLSSRLAASPGSGDVFVGGVVTYHTALKQELLGIEGIPVISAECAEAMAAGAAQLCSVDVAVSITGVAGPETQEDKPIGLVFGAVATPHGTTARDWHFHGEPGEIRAAAVDSAIALLIDTLGAHQDLTATIEGGRRPAEPTAQPKEPT